MEGNTFYLDFNVTGSERKRLVNAISEYIGADPRYLGPPTFAYEVDYFHIDKAGCVSFDDRAYSEEIEGLIEALAQQGFVSQVSDFGCDDETAEEPAAGSNADAEPAQAVDGLTISLPLEGFDEAALDRLRRLVDSKASLIRKALGAARLDIRTDENTLSFPWWDKLPAPEEVQAYTVFIAALCKMARDARRVNATEHSVDSEKYAFRCFLLRLSFIGSENKTLRKILLRNLSGSSAFPDSRKADAFSAVQKAKRDAAKDAAGEAPA